MLELLESELPPLSQGLPQQGLYMASVDAQNLSLLQIAKLANDETPTGQHRTESSSTELGPAQQSW